MEGIRALALSALHTAERVVLDTTGQALGSLRDLVELPGQATLQQLVRQGISLTGLLRIQ
jgi:hypothetical protein